MNLNNRLKIAIDECNLAFRKNWVFTCAARFSELVSAEERGLITAAWRKEVDVEKIKLAVEANRSEIEKEWLEDFRRLKRVVDVGGKHLFEEVMNILTLRSELEFTLGFVGEEQARLLAQFEEAFKENINENLETVRECQSHAQAGLDKYLSEHWWWRY